MIFYFKYIQGEPKKGRSQKMKIGHGGGFLKKKSMTNKIKKFLYTLWKLFFIGHGFLKKKKPTMADFHFLRTPFFLVHPVLIEVCRSNPAIIQYKGR